MNTLSLILLAVQYLPFVIAGVKAVEESLAGSSGATKKAAVLSAVQAASQVGEQVPEQHVKVVSALIDNVVTAFNQSGAFKK